MNDGKDLHQAGEQPGTGREISQGAGAPGYVQTEAGGTPAAPPPSARNDTESAVVKSVGKSNFAAIFIPATEKEKAEGKTGQIVKFSDQEAAVMQVFLRTQNYQQTAQDVGIKEESVKRILRRPHLRKFLDEIIQRAAIAEGTDLKWGIKEMRLVWEGEKKVDPIQMQAMKMIVDVLKPKSAGVQVNVQQNSHYGGLGKEAIDVEWANARSAAAEGV